MNDFRFLEWNVYKDAKMLAKFVFQVTEKFPPHHRFGLGSQLQRSAISTVLNVAEGSGKSSDKELNRFFNIAIGSAYETLAGLDLALEEDLITKEEFMYGKEMAFKIAKQLGGFKKKLKL